MTESSDATLFAARRSWSLAARMGLAFVIATSLVAHSDPIRGMSSVHVLGAVLVFTMLFSLLLRPLWRWAVPSIAAIAALALLDKQQRRVVAFALPKDPISNAIGVTKTNVTYMPYAYHIAGHLRYGHLPATSGPICVPA